MIQSFCFAESATNFAFLKEPQRKVGIMLHRVTGCLCIAVAFVLSAGCASQTSTTTTAKSDEEKEVRDTFVAFQKALKTHDDAKLWTLLDKESQESAERQAKTIREAYAGASAEEKKKQEQALGLSDKDLTELNGVGFIKSARFHGKYDEIADSEIKKIEVSPEQAVVHYHEPDGDNEKRRVVREDGKWKVSVRMPN